MAGGKGAREAGLAAEEVHSPLHTQPGWVLHVWPGLCLPVALT